MLHQEFITIGKLRTAFDLSDSEVNGLFTALNHESIFPYALWHYIWESYWKEFAEDTAQGIGIAVPYFPQEKVEKITFFEFTQELEAFLASVFPLLQKYNFIKGFEAILQEAYDPTPQELSDMMELVQTLLPKETDFGEPLPSLEMAQAQERSFYRSNVIRYIEYYLPHTIAVNKKDAVQHLVACGYPYRQEIKGLSKSFFEHITVQSFSMPTYTVPHKISPTANSETPHLCIPRHLWEGKTPMAVRDAMREANFDDAVIAHVLYSWCGQNNKTYVGKLLGTANKEDSTYRKACHRLLEKAQTLNITTT